MYSDELWDEVGQVHQADCQSAAAGRSGPSGWAAPEAPQGLWCANVVGRLANKRGLYPDTFGSKTPTPESVQSPANRLNTL
jgi:hypothetical protein